MTNPDLERQIHSLLDQAPGLVRDRVLAKRLLERRRDLFGRSLLTLGIGLLVLAIFVMRLTPLDPLLLIVVGVVLVFVAAWHIDSVNNARVRLAKRLFRRSRP